jgi:hypothetical protein
MKEDTKIWLQYAFEQIKKEVRRDFPDDKMMYELHVIRYLNFLKRRRKAQNKSS